MLGTSAFVRRLQGLVLGTSAFVRRLQRAGARNVGLPSSLKELRRTSRPAATATAALRRIPSSIV